MLFTVRRLFIYIYIVIHFKINYVPEDMFSWFCNPSWLFLWLCISVLYIYTVHFYKKMTLAVGLRNKWIEHQPWPMIILSCYLRSPSFVRNEWYMYMYFYLTYFYFFYSFSVLWWCWELRILLPGSKHFIAHLSINR